jgi:hypothetical protein
MPISVWKTYLPNLNVKLPQITEMYNELLKYKFELGELNNAEKTN